MLKEGGKVTIAVHVSLKLLVIDFLLGFFNELKWLVADKKIVF